MINFGNILKKSISNTWKYRTLWIFGLILAITAGTRGNSSRGDNTSSKLPNAMPNSMPDSMPDAPQWMQQFVQWFTVNVEPLFTHPAEHVGTLVTIGLIVLGVMLLCCAIGALVRYPSETAVIRMVDEYEQSGTKMKFKQGWKQGWNRRAFRLWVIDLILSVPVLLLMVPTGLLGWFLYQRFSGGAYLTGTLGIIGAISLGAICLLAFIAVVLFIALVRNFIVRAVALDDLGVKEAFSTGWAMFKRNLKSAGLMWLIMCGINIGFGILVMIVFFLLIPAYLILIIPAGIVAAVPGLIGYGISSIFASGPLVWMITALSAIPFFFTIVFSPLLMVDGWYKVFDSNVWTLTYREIKAKENLEIPALPETETSK